MLIDTRTKSRAYGRHSAFAPFFASTWLHSLPYAEVSACLFITEWLIELPSGLLAFPQKPVPLTVKTFVVNKVALCAIWIDGHVFFELFAHIVKADRKMVGY